MSSNPWLIAPAAMICAIIILYGYLRIVVLFCWLPQRINFSRNRVPRRLLLDESNTDNPSLRFDSHGLEFSTMHSLPVTQFKEEGEGEMNKTRSTDCAVCLGEFKEGEWLRYLPSCSHSFHTSCIDTWFLNHANCPLCRTEVQSLKLENLESPVSHHSPPQTLRREDFFRERAAHYELLRSQILQNSVSRRDTIDENWLFILFLIYCFSLASIFLIIQGWRIGLENRLIQRRMTHSLSWLRTQGKTLNCWKGLSWNPHGAESNTGKHFSRYYSHQAEWLNSMSQIFLFWVGFSPPLREKSGKTSAIMISLFSSNRNGGLPSTPHILLIQVTWSCLKFWFTVETSGVSQFFV